MKTRSGNCEHFVKIENSAGSLHRASVVSFYPDGNLRELYVYQSTSFKKLADTLSRYAGSRSTVLKSTSRKLYLLHPDRFMVVKKSPHATFSKARKKKIANLIKSQMDEVLKPESLESHSKVYTDASFSPGKGASAGIVSSNGFSYSTLLPEAGSSVEAELLVLQTACAIAFLSGKENLVFYRL